MISTRRSFLVGLAAVISAPAIVRASSLMPIKRPPPMFVFEADLVDMIPHAGEDGYTLILHPQQFDDLMRYARERVLEVCSPFALDEGDRVIHHYSGTKIIPSRYMPLIGDLDV